MTQGKEALRPRPKVFRIPTVNDQFQSLQRIQQRVDLSHGFVAVCAGNTRNPLLAPTLFLLLNDAMNRGGIEVDVYISSLLTFRFDATNLLGLLKYQNSSASFGGSRIGIHTDLSEELPDFSAEKRPILTYFKNIDIEKLPSALRVHALKSPVHVLYPGSHRPI